MYKIDKKLIMIFIRKSIWASLTEQTGIRTEYLISNLISYIRSNIILVKIWSCSDMKIKENLDKSKEATKSYQRW